MPRSLRDAHQRGEHSGAADGADASSREKSFVRLPHGAFPPLRVWVNGVEQREGDDYVINGRLLEFDKFLAKEGRIGLFRWALMFFGIAGTYRKNDSVDVQFTTPGGQVRHVTGLDFLPPDQVADGRHS
jgi:hypothetical protein